MVGMLVGQQYLCNLLWLVSQCSQSVHIVADAFTDIDGRRLFWCTIWETCWQTGIYQYNLLASVYQIVLQTATIADVFVKLLLSFLATKYEWLRIESVFSEFYSFDVHSFSFYILGE